MLPCFGRGHDDARGPARGRGGLAARLDAKGRRVLYTPTGWARWRCNGRTIEDLALARAQVIFAGAQLTSEADYLDEHLAADGRLLAEIGLRDFTGVRHRAPVMVEQTTALPDLLASSR